MVNDMNKTLDDFRGSFLFQTNAFRHINMKELSRFLSQNRKVLHARCPEDYALDFYLLNHSVYALNNKFSRNENLDEKHVEFMNFYVEKTLEIFTSAFLYLLCITTKESRHMLLDKYDNIGWTYENDMIDNIRSLGYYECFEYTKTLKVKKEQNGYSGKHALLDTDNMPDVSLSTYLKYLEHMYNNWEWHDEYGGDVWATITNVLYRFVEGEISPETLVDNMWTLSHNNGLIFNKDVVFSSYKSEAGMLEILNAQAIGRLPEYVDQSNVYSPKGKKVFNKVKKVIPEIFEKKSSYEGLISEIADYACSHN
jgi:hypothetical protein